MEDLVASGARRARRQEHRRKLFPLLRKLTLVCLDVARGLRGGELVAFGEYDAEWHAVLPEHLDEAQVDLLRFEAAVDKHEEVVHALALQYVIEDYAGEVAALSLRDACVAVTGQVDQIP